MTPVVTDKCVLGFWNELTKQFILFNEKEYDILMTQQKKFNSSLSNRNNSFLALELTKGQNQYCIWSLSEKYFGHSCSSKTIFKDKTGIYYKF